LGEPLVRIHFARVEPRRAGSRRACLRWVRRVVWVPEVPPPHAVESHHRRPDHRERPWAC